MEKISFDFSIPDTLNVKISGDWRISAGAPFLKGLIAQFDAHPEVVRISFHPEQSFQWDSTFIALLFALYQECDKRGVQVLLDTLPEGAQKILALALKAYKQAAVHKKPQESFLENVGEKVLEAKENTFALLDFLGQLSIALLKFFTGRAYFRMDEFMLIVQRCGANALGLVSLISLLVGMILAFIGAIQLKIFGAQIYIADIVGIAMVRVMGSVMTGVLLAGRTGASFAAELGIMQTNEEIDAFRTLGLNPIELLVMPRVLALVIMMPLLTLYAGLMGILGGFIVSTSMMGINPVEYLTHTQSAVNLNNVWIGLVHSFVFGIIIAVSGCFRGMNCQRSAEGLGVATTSAVVTAITYIVIATAIITYICQILGV